MDRQEINERDRLDNRNRMKKDDDEDNQEQNNQQHYLIREEQTQKHQQNPIIQDVEHIGGDLYNQKEKKEKSDVQEEDVSQTIDEQLAGYHVIGEDSTNQVLQVNLYPKEKIFVRGKILYANFDYLSKNDIVGYQSITNFLRQVSASGFHPMRKIHNAKPHVSYFGISKGGGKLLTIENDIYGDDIYVHPGRIILSNVNHENSIIKKHPDLSTYQSKIKIGEKSKPEKTLIVLQSKNNNVIIEKYLGPNEKLYVQERLVLALSGTVKANASLGGLFTAKLVGPGWVFIENDSNSSIRQNKALVITLMFMFLCLWYEVFIDKS